MLDEELGTVKNDIKKLASDMKELEKDLSDPNEISEKLMRRESRSRTIICRFIRFKDEQKILENSKKLKKTEIYIYKDFCKP